MDLTVEEDIHNQRRKSDEPNAHEEQMPLAQRLLHPACHEIEERKLHRDVLIAGQEVERSGEVIEHADRLYDDYRLFAIQGVVGW